MTSDFAPIRSGDKTEQILALLRDLVLQGKLEPGSELPPERELAARLNVGRYSLREALRLAQAQGLVEITHGRRPRVSHPSTKPVAEVFDIAAKRSKVSLSDLLTARVTLEGEIAALAAPRVTDDVLERLRSNVARMREHADDLDYCVSADLEFHNMLVRLADNDVFKIMLDSVAHHLREARVGTISATGVGRAVLGHERIIEALKKRDPDLARITMRRHLEMTPEEIRTVEESPAPSSNSDI